jgi:ClpP class serine protease
VCKKAFSKLSNKDKPNQITQEEYEKYRNMPNRIHEQIKKDIAEAINQHLGKTDPNKQKKLYWDRKGKDGKLLNTRFFLKENAGYISQINNYYDKMCEQEKQNNPEELQKLLNLAQNAYYRQICACY